MLLTLLYHRVGVGKYANPLTFFEKHFSFIKKKFHSLHPGDPLPKAPAVCLTFDDAYFDFYHFIYPLLKKYDLKAVLAVPTAFIEEKGILSPENRLEKLRVLQKPLPLPSEAYCSWAEIKEMHDSKLVHIASHSVNHLPLTSKEADPAYELAYSKTLIEKKLQASVQTFVYPYGKWNATVHSLAKKHYPFIMRIGNAGNRSWQNNDQLIYRINGDAQVDPTSFYHPIKRFKYSFKYFLNTLLKK